MSELSMKNTWMKQQMNKQTTLNVLLDAQTKCKNFHFACYSLTLTKEEIDYLIGKVSEDIKPRGKYTIVVLQDNRELTKLEKQTKDQVDKFILDLQGELDKQFTGFSFSVIEKHKLVKINVTKKEHPYGDY